MKLKLDIEIPHSAFEISHAHKGISIGSCFSSIIGNKLLASKFPILVNPLGTIYNPVSVSNALNLLLGNISLTANDVFLSGDVWQSFYLHTSFSALQQQQVIENFEAVKRNFQEQFQTIDYVLITLGTAWIYEHKQSGRIVNNCHKQSSSQFVRSRLTVDECVKTLTDAICVVRQKNPSATIIFTVSPVRHWKDGATQNQLSKSTLLLAIESLQSTVNNVLYFPAYELVMDDLRDYRFYADDLIHPNSQAVEYIWERFAETYFSPETLQILPQIEQIRRAMEHHPFNPKSELYRNFLQQNLEKCLELSHKFPLLNLNEELKFFSR